MESEPKYYQVEITTPSGIYLCERMNYTLDGYNGIVNKYMNAHNTITEACVIATENDTTVIPIDTLKQSVFSIRKIY